MQRILVTGASGLLGRAIMAELGTVEDWAVQGTAFSRSGHGLDRLDLRDPTAVRRYVGPVRPDVIVHSAAQRDPDVCENDQEATRRLNVDATQTLATLARELGAWLIYISTDYVFDGTNPPYSPADTPHPLNEYGQSKLDGEEVVRATTPGACILRVPILFGPVESLDESAVTKIAKLLLDHVAETVTLDNWGIRFPTHVNDVAVVLHRAIEHHTAHPECCGTFHSANSTPMTKYDMGRVMAPHIGYDPDRIRPNDRPTQGAPRPWNTQLDCSALESLNIRQYTAFAESIGEILAPFAQDSEGTRSS